MGLFKSFKKMLAPIGGVVGFALGGPMGAALGSGIGSLAGGGDVKDALLAGALGYGAGSFAKSAGFGLGSGSGIGSLLPSYSAPTQALAKTGGFDPSKMIGVGGPEKGKGILSMFDDMSMGTKLGLGAGALALAGGMFGEEEEEEKGFSYADTGPGKVKGTLVGRSGKRYDMDDPTDMKQYADELRELQDPGYNYYTDPYRPVARSSGYAHGGDVHAGGGEVDGPGTGTSDSVPARLSDGEFVLTAKAVRGAGGGDRDVGAARLYDMMSDLEATG